MTTPRTALRRTYRLWKRCFRNRLFRRSVLFAISALLLVIGIARISPDTNQLPSDMTKSIQPAEEARVVNRSFITTAQGPDTPAVPECRHIVYVRIPKTGSSTMTLLVWRFAWTRNLSVLAVNPNFEGTRSRLTDKWFFLPPPGKRFDVMAEHVLYNRTSYSNFFPKDTIYTTLLREPMSLLYSTVCYVTDVGVTGENKIEEYLKNPSKYDESGLMADRSYTKNPQSSFLGLKKKYYNNNKKINAFIVSIAMDIPVVMILERFDESLILLRRLTGWPMKDVIYSDQNMNRNKPKLEISRAQREKYKQLSFADHKLYDFFFKKLTSQIKTLGQTFHEEVMLFRKYKELVNNFCRMEIITDDDLHISKTQYNEAFTVNRKDCNIINVEPLVLISNLRKRQGSFPYLSPHL